MGQSSGWSGLLCLLLVVLACDVDRLIPPEKMPLSENGVFTEDGRFFVVGGNVLYEVTGGPDVFDATTVLEETCYLGGLTDRGNELFATCMDPEFAKPTELLRIDPKDPQAPVVDRVEFPGQPGLMLLNGMDFGPDGALYLSDTGALLSGDPAVYRARITREDPLTIAVEPFIDNSALTVLLGQGGGLVPNGIRFHEDTMFLSRGPSVVRTRLRANGTHGPLREIYTAPALNIIDDFDIAAGHLIMAETNALGAIDPSVFRSHVVAIELDGTFKGRQPLSFIPSSTAVRRGDLFGSGVAVVTSYFNGGLYRLTPRPR